MANLQLQARVWFRKAEFCKRIQTMIVEGYRAEIIDGLPEGTFIYTGVCATRQEVIAELVSHLKAHNLTGTLKVVS